MGICEPFPPIQRREIQFYEIRPSFRDAQGGGFKGVGLFLNTEFREFSE